MNYSTAVMLINENIKAVKVSYDINYDGTGEDIKTFKTLDTTLEKGDLVLVPTDTRHKYTVCRVEEVEVEIDFESSVKINWIVNKVSTKEHKSILAEEGKWIGMIKDSEKRKKREDIKKNMLDMHADVGIDTLAIASMGGSTPIEDNSTE